jgi:hypothetical protein
MSLQHGIVFTTHNSFASINCLSLSAAIDDDGFLDLNSDHVVFTISLLKTHLKRNKVKDKVKWKLSHNTD